MARGKLKYKDVVGTKGKKNQKPHKKHLKQRKKFNLHDNKKQGFKRKAVERPTENHKQPRIEKTIEPRVPDDFESDVEETQMDQLLSTFCSSAFSKNFKAADSSEDSSSDDESHGNEHEGEEIANDENEIDAPVEETLENEEDSDAESSSNEESIISPDLDALGENVDDNDNDPFVKHICFDLHKNLLHAIQSSPVPVKSDTITWPILGRLMIQAPEWKVESIEKHTLDDKMEFAPPVSNPVLLNSKAGTYFIKSQIVNTVKEICNNQGDDILNPLQMELFSIMNNYQDLYFPGRTFSNADDIRITYTLHALNHILKTRLRVIHHNAKLSKKENTSEFRDQGLVRPKVLIIVPFKDSAYKIIQLIISLLLPNDKGHVLHKKRFIEEYTGNELTMPKKNPKPEDYEKIFTGNVNDNFKIGITVTKKSLKLFADFYSSDIIIASPLGLRTTIGAEGEAERDFDFLASIELLILDQTELFFMQNWDHIIHLFNHLHLQPKSSHGTDFSRVRNWSLDGLAKYYRQTVIFSSFALPEINSIFNKNCQNYAGKVKISNPVLFGTIEQVVVQIPHIFYKFCARSAQQAIDNRFDYFIGKILPQQREPQMKQTLIFVSNYFDYVRLRNYFKREDVNFVQICEYSKDGKIAKARDKFYHDDAHFLLYTERYHFFNRIRVKGIRHLVFYQLPMFSHFYYEICNLLREGNLKRKAETIANMSVSILYSKYDAHQLAAIVGTDRSLKMLASEKSVHMVVTEASNKTS